MLRIMGMFVALAILALGVALALSATQRRHGPDYQKIAQWGTKGAAEGQFADPTGIAVRKGFVYVADARNSRIQIFTPQGQFVDRFPKADKAATEPELGRPMNLDIAGDTLLVPDYQNDKILIYDLQGHFLRAFGEAGETEGTLSAPVSAVALPEKSIIVTDFYGKRVQRFDEKGAWQGPFETSGARHYIYPSDLAARSDGGLVVAEGYAHRFHVFDAAHRHIGTFGGFHGIRLPGMTFNGWFKTLSAIALDEQVRVFATDFYNGRVQIFDKEGRFVSNFGKGQLLRPFGIALDEAGDVYVVDNGANNVTVWRAKGQ